MIRMAIGFFLFGLLAYILGANNVAGISIEIGKIILEVFLALAVLMIVAGIVIGKRISNELK